jgi:hypothetical protein
MVAIPYIDGYFVIGTPICTPKYPRMSINLPGQTRTIRYGKAAIYAAFWITLNYFWVCVVEAGGIEPPSEDLQELATTRLFRDLELALRTPANGLP